MEPAQTLKRLLEENTAKVGIVGLGYVGLPLLLEFVEHGFDVLGFDIDARKVDALSRGESYIRYISADRIRQPFCQSGKAAATTDFSRISEVDAILICVPTPLNKYREPDLSYVEKTAHAIAPHLRAGQLVVLESTTYPGTTDEVLVPILRAGSKLKIGDELFVAYSPEREDPGNREFSTGRIPKVVGGTDEHSRDLAVALYEKVVCRVVPVSSTRVAEATKLLENIFRSVNIA
ncbi:MAG: nucleotide sugar dehydrogenase, partial [Lentisphaerae bacterium]